jgi:hypothetical protein
VAEITGLPESDIRLEEPRDLSLGDVALPCFLLAKAKKQAPPQAAAELANALSGKLDKMEVRAAGPYVNITIERALLAQTILAEIAGKGASYGTSNTLTIASINEVDQRILTIPTSEVTVVNYGASVAAGTFVRSAVKYLRITNKDDTNYIKLHITSATDDAWFKLEAGKSFELHNGLIETASSFSAWADITSISAIADTAAVDIEYFIALT